MKWVNLDVNSSVVESLARALGISKRISRLLVQRKIESPEAAHQFLNPSLENLEDPLSILNVDAVVDRLHRVLMHCEHVAVIGDYDVDGVTSLALLARCFRHFGISFSHFFPDRETEGYGLSAEILERIGRSVHFDVLVALDCGTRSVELIRRTREPGCDVIVVDHHQLGSEVPNCLLVNPHAKPERHSESARQLCTVGLVFKVVHAFVKRLRQLGHPLAFGFHLKPFLDFVALGTVADLVPLQNENRLLVHYGLEQLRRSQTTGVRALVNTVYSRPNPYLTANDIAFQLAPRINVGGRIGSAQIPFELLLEEDMNRCEQLAKTLDGMNQKRQALERAIFLESQELIRTKSANAPAWVLYGSNWHVGIVGIVAGKLAKKYSRPIWVLGQNGAFAKGSGRSIEGVNIASTMERSNIFLQGWGGHPSAVGLTIVGDQIEAFERCLNRCLSEDFPDGFPDVPLRVADTVRVADITPSFVDEFSRLEPFGQGNAAPVFHVTDVSWGPKITYFGSNDSHFRCCLEDSTIPLFVIGWHMGDKMRRHEASNERIHLATKISWNVWRNERQLQLQVVDWQN